MKSARHRMNQVIEFFPDAIMVIDAQGILITWNKAMEALTGVRSTDILGKGNYEHALPFYGHRRPVMIDLVMQYDEHIASRYQYVKQDGDRLISESFFPNFHDQGPKWLWNVAAPLYDENDQVVGAIESIRDISELRQTVTTLKESQEQFSLFMDLLPHGVFIKDDQSKVIYVNQYVKDLFNGETWIGKDAHGAFPENPDIAEAMHADDQKALMQGFTTVEETMPDIQGHLRVFQTTKFHINRENKSPLLGGIGLDITDRVKAEEALRQSEERFKNLYQEAKKTEELYNSLLDSTLDAIVLYDLLGQVIFVNQGFTKTFGWIKEELKNGVPYTPETEREITLTNIMRVVKDGTPIQNFETLRYTKAGELIDVSISASRFNDHEGKPAGMLVILRDITERKDTEKKLAETLDKAQRLKDRAQAANRAKSEFLANMSHELRTPLNSVIGFSNILSRSQNLDRDEKKHLGIIRRSGNHLLTLINDVLEFSKIEAGKSVLNEKAFHLRQMLDDVSKLFEDRIQNKHLTFTIHVDEGLPEIIKADEGKLRQVLINLIGNAIKFTPQGGITLRVGIGYRKTGDGGQDMEKEDSQLNPIPIPNSQPLISISFEVHDTGIGIHDAEKNHLFTAFTQAKDDSVSQQGAGLGLAISRKFVHMMQGEINFESQIGKGSVFRFHIMARLCENAVTPRDQPSRELMGVAPNQPAFRILIVDDDANNRQLLLEILEPFGFELKLAENGLEALNLFNHWQPHLILMDIRMPIMDGFQATERIRVQEKNRLASTKADPPVKIIAITASAFKEQKERILNAGCDDFISKPFEEVILFDMLSRHLGVEFVYQRRDTDKLPNDVSVPRISVKADLSRCPAHWKTRVKEAAKNLDHEALFALIKEIEIEKPDLADMLLNLLDDFEYHKIIEILDESL